MSLVFNLLWVNPRPEQDRAQDVAFNGPNNLRTVEDVEAVILFPSLMTPFVGHDKGGPWIELLLAAKATITPAHVNRQLKIDEGLPAEKRFHADWLFSGVGNNIEVEVASKDGDILRSHEVFEGVIHAMFEKRLSSAGFTKFFRVRFQRSAFKSRPLGGVREALEAKGVVCTSEWRAEAHDQLLKAMLEERNVVGGYDSLPEKGRYAFKLDQHGPQPWLDRKEPIQAYHPVYLFGSDEPEHLNFGHLTDIHLNYRLEILKQTPVRVIEGDGAKELSVPLGKLLQTTNRSFTQLLDTVAGRSDAHALLIGGDLIDHQLNAWTNKKVEPTMQAVWDAVDVTEDGQKHGYVPCVDMIGFYSLLIRFCRSHAKPVFGIAGNHDAYFKPFGISPRAAGVRANAGIPADLNLTLYEAILAFGPSYSDFTYPDPLSEAPSSFEKKWMEWFYSVFTPFGEASVRLPKQRVVCLGWGNQEDMVGGGQGSTHLPRADDSVSDVQLKLLQNASKKHDEYKVLVVSHFTVASFEESIPMLTHGKPSQGSLRSAGEEDFFNMGTFEQNHDAFVRLLNERKISCILTGHSHRRGVYFLGEQQQAQHGRAAIRSLPVTIYDPETYPWSSADGVDTKHVPAIIVSDSGGPFPRYNLSGEFKCWGSDKPGGSVVKFAPNGSLREVEVIRSGADNPRLAVSLDYADVQEGIVWEHPIRTSVFMSEQEAQAMRPGVKTPWSYEFQIGLRKEMTDFGLSVREIRFFAAGAGAASLVLPVNGSRSVTVNAPESRNFFDWLRQTRVGGLFLAVTFNWDHALASRYDVAGAWLFEVAPFRVAVRGALAQAAYQLPRPIRKVSGASPFSYADLPDFEARRRGASGHGAPAS